MLSWVGGGFGFLSFALVASNLSASLLGVSSRLSVGKEEVNSSSIFIGTMAWLHIGLGGKQQIAASASSATLNDNDPHLGLLPVGEPKFALRL